MDVEFGTLLLSTQRAQQRALRQQQCTVVAVNGRGKREHATHPVAQRVEIKSLADAAANTLMAITLWLHNP